MFLISFLCRVMAIACFCTAIRMAIALYKREKRIDTLEQKYSVEE